MASVKKQFGDYSTLNIGPISDKWKQVFKLWDVVLRSKSRMQGSCENLQ